MKKARTEREWLDHIQGLVQSYRRVFDGPVGEAMLADLADFCSAHSTCAHPNPHVMYLREGRREVFLRMQDYLLLTPEEIMVKMKLYKAPQQPTNIQDTE